MVPLITPLTREGELDRDCLPRLIEHTLSGGVKGLFLLGTTGEGPSLGRRLRVQVVEEVCRLVKGRVPVMVAVTDTAIADSVELAEVAAHAGADAVVSAGPAYYPLTQQDLLTYVETLAQSCPLPLFLYNMPSHTHIWFEPTTVAQAARLPNVAGLKDSSGDMSYLLRVLTLLEERPQFALLIGPEELMGQAVLAGVHGGVNGGANLFPALYTRLYRAAAEGNKTEVTRLQEVVMTVSSIVYSKNGYLQGMKCAAAALGLCENVLAPPLLSWSGEECASLLLEMKVLTSLVNEAIPFVSDTEKPG